jgi:hypothetical protein
MPRAARVRRAPNQEPVSLATNIPILDVVAAIDTIEPVATSDTYLDLYYCDPILTSTNNDAYSTPTPLISKEDLLINNVDADADKGYIYPPPLIPSRYIPLFI